MFGKQSAHIKQDLPSTPTPNDLNRFSLQELRRIHNELLENKAVTDSNGELVVERLRVIAEMVVYGDNKSELLFDFFCEKNMLALFLEIMWSPGCCPSSVHIQILQTLSILISCVKNNTSLYYLLSNNYINDIINFPHQLELDESLGAQYASFVKSLSLRLNDQTVQFFFIEETKAFPLLIKSIQLLESSDPMIRISAQTAILNVYKVDDSRARAYALNVDVLQVLFKAIINIMNGQFLYLKCLYEMSLNANGPQSGAIKIEQQLSDLAITIEDWLYYLQDIFDLKIIDLMNYFELTLTTDFILPMINCIFEECTIKTYEHNCDSSISLNEKGNGNSAAVTQASLYYLLQILRILSSTAIKFGILSIIQFPKVENPLLLLNSNDRQDEHGIVDSSSFRINIVEKMFSSKFVRNDLLGVYILNFIFGALNGSNTAHKEIFDRFKSLNVFPVYSTPFMESCSHDFSALCSNNNNKNLSIFEQLCGHLQSCGNGSLVNLQCTIDCVLSILICVSKVVSEDSNLEGLLLLLRMILASTFNFILEKVCERAEKCFEDVLVLINEELKRYSGVNWTSSFERMVNLPTLILPDSTFQYFSPDYKESKSEVEILKLEFHAMLLLKVMLDNFKNLLMKNVNGVSNGPLFGLIADCGDFASMQETSILGELGIGNATVDMKGKKFLDAIIVQLPDQHDTPKSNSNENSSITSSLTFGLLGSMKRQNRTPKSHTSESSSNNKTAVVVSGTKVLFVQDPTFLLLVSQQKHDGKSTFKVKTVAPLLFTEAKQDLIEKKKFRLTVQSWRSFDNIDIFDSITPLEEKRVSSNNCGSERIIDGFLKFPHKSQFFELTIIMDTEQACTLAVMHIQQRRKAMQLHHLNSFKHIVQQWGGNVVDFIKEG